MSILSSAPLNKTQQTPINRDPNTHCETYEKLKSLDKTVKQLERLGLYTTTHLHQRNNI